MKKKKLISIIAIAVAVVLVATLVLSLTLCNSGSDNKDAIVIMSEELSNNFNPFYATSGADQDVIGMTQVGMLSTDSNGKTVAGNDYATVVKAFKTEKYNKDGALLSNASKDEVDKTVYTFVLKNGLKFSDGKPLTMNDVLFSMYENLDPVYTGSSTMYSIDIQGLKAYRTQNPTAKDDSDTESDTNAQANASADNRIMYLVGLYQDTSENLPDNSDLTSGTYAVTEAEMREAINNLTSVTDDGYKSAVCAEKDWDTFDFKAQVLEDYNYILKTYKEELENNYKAAQDSFDLTAKPYSDWKEYFENDIFKFLYYMGEITPTYEKVAGKDNKEKIVSFSDETSYKTLTKEKAIANIYNYTVEEKFDTLLSYSDTAGIVFTSFAAKAKEIILHEDVDEGALSVPTIAGIKSLGHNTDVKSVVINGTTYNVASGKENHNDDGTTKNNTYDVLEITINGVDPKAIYNFGFTVAPAHYYSNIAVDIWNNQFGVKWSDADFQSKVIQGDEQTEIPVGAGPYAATNEQNEDNPKGSEFVSKNIVYFKRNNYFQTSFGDKFEVKTEKLRFQVIRSINAIDNLEKGTVDFITPQFTDANVAKLDNLKKKGIETLTAWQLGYGYIGINAGKVEDINLRRAIMSAMDVSLALQYYSTGTAKTINWPMSMESWAYPWADKDNNKQANTGTEHDYTRYDANGEDDTAGKAKVIEKIKKYMNAADNGAGVQAGDSKLKITFTIAGSSATEHPVYQVFLNAAELLNSCGWQIEVKPDSQALLKLTNGSLTVWAAAWGSTIDPDMYQVYHKDSTATSVKAWGYPEIINNADKRVEEYGIICELSEIIEKARETDVESERIPLYKEAMEYVLDLAVELPVYQRMNLYAYNSKTVKGFRTDVNPYTSPLEKVWELELVK